jgi:hypothetical protein
MAEIREIFSEAYRDCWYCRFSHSAIGTDELSSVGTAERIKEYMAARSIYSIADLGCGVFGWQKGFLDQFLMYVGMDVVEGLQFSNMKGERFNATRSIVLGDLTNDPLPRGELAIVRDVFQYLPEESILLGLLNIARFEYSYLMVTNFPSIQENTDASLGSYRPYNLLIPPYNLPAPIASIEEPDVTGLQRRELLVFDAKEVKKLFFDVLHSRNHL